MTPLGAFAVRAEPAEVAAFRAATGLPPGDMVPVTFPDALAGVARGA